MLNFVDGCLFDCDVDLFVVGQVSLGQFNPWALVCFLQNLYICYLMWVLREVHAIKGVAVLSLEPSPWVLLSIFVTLLHIYFILFYGSCVLFTYVDNFNAQDYYSILGVSRNSSKSEIKSGELHLCCVT